jgi:hypothetical protein
VEEFIKQNYYYINEGVIVLAALVGVFCLEKYKHTPTQYFIYFLVYVVCIELLGYYPLFAPEYTSMSWVVKITNGTILEENYLWYTLFWQLGSAIFLSFYYIKILTNDYYKKIIKFSIVFYVLFSVFYSILNYHIYYNDMIKLVWILGVCQTVLCIILYFLEVLNSDKIMSFYRSFEFYVAAVFFIWLLIKTPLSFYQIYYSKADWNFIFLRRDIILAANLFMYLTFVFAFIFCKPDHDKYNQFGRIS